MEINSSKQLHKPAASVALLILVLFALSLTVLNAYQNGNSSVARGLVTPLVHVHPAANGLSKVTTKTASPNLPPDINQAGQSAQLTLMLQ